MAAALAHRPSRGGHAWFVLQYLLGFRGLGWDVTFVDRAQPSAAVATGRLRESEQADYLSGLMRRYGLDNSYSLLLEGGAETAGLSRKELTERIRSSEFLLNVMGYLTDQELLSAASRRVFLDVDPGFGQMWSALGLHDTFAGHDVFLTVGGNLGEPDCPIPTCGIDWIGTVPPVVLDHWPSADPAADDAPFTSVASWRGAYGPVEYGGKTYGLRVHEFRKFAELPRLTSQRFELALDIDPSDQADRTLLERNRWRLVDPNTVAGDPWSYRRFIEQSKAEFGAAKNMYVETNSGWLSDRSVCYLASGRPVLVQDTGIHDSYATGLGLLTYRSLDEAAGGVEAIAGDPTGHGRAAREIAESYFDSRGVLARLVEKVRP